MEEADLFGGLEALGDFEADAHDEGGVERRAVHDELRQVAARYELHFEIRAAAVFAEGVDLRDVRVVQPGRALGLVLEGLVRGASGFEAVADDLDGDAAPELFLFREERRAHAAGAEVLEEQEVREAAGDFPLRAARRARHPRKRLDAPHVDGGAARFARRRFHRLDRDLGGLGGGSVRDRESFEVGRFRCSGSFVVHFLVPVVDGPAGLDFGGGVGENLARPPAGAGAFRCSNAAIICNPSSFV